MGAAPAIIAEAGRAKAIGNGLRELDRFLSLLIDEVAAVVAPAGLDRAAFARQRNTANKLRTIRAAMALPSPDHDRLRTIGRTRDGLFHCAAMVRQGDATPCPRRRAHAERLTPDAAALVRLCAAYDRIAAELMAACAAHRSCSSGAAIT